MALLGALLWAGLGTPAGGQHANDRVVFSFTSSATLKGSIAGADRPYSNDSRLPNASVVTLVETDTAGSSTLAREPARARTSPQRRAAATNRCMVSYAQSENAAATAGEPAAAEFF